MKKACIHIVCNETKKNEIMLIIDKMLCAYKMEPLHPPISLVNAFRLYDLGKIFQSFSIATASKWLTTPKPCNLVKHNNATLWLIIYSVEILYEIIFKT